MSKKYILIDSSYLIFKSFYGYPNFERGGQYLGAFFGFAKTIHSLINKYNTKNIIFTHDVSAPTWRHKIFDQYKAGRPTPPPELTSQFKLIKEWTPLLTPNNLFKEGFEADDVIKTVCDHLLIQDEKNEIYIYSSDKDLYQLFTYPNVKFIHGDKVFGLDEFMEKFETDPYKWVDFKTFVGDNSDNLRGVDGVGPKGAAKILSQGVSFDDLFEYIENGSNKIVEEFLESKKTNFKIVDKIRQNIDLIKQTRKLAKLQFVEDINPAYLDTEINLMGGVEYYQKYEFKSLLRGLGVSEKKETLEEENLLF